MSAKTIVGGVAAIAFIGAVGITGPAITAAEILDQSSSVSTAHADVVASASTTATDRATLDGSVALASWSPLPSQRPPLRECREQGDRCVLDESSPRRLPRGGR